MNKNEAIEFPSRDNTFAWPMSGRCCLYARHAQLMVAIANSGIAEIALQTI
jgi:hypothetical protein